MLYYVRYVMGLFGVYFPLYNPHIVNVLHWGCHILWMLYVSCCKVVLIIQDILMFVFGPLTEIVIIITILIQCLFFLCVFNHSYSTDKVLVILIHRAYHASRIYPNSFDYAAYFCGSSIGSIIIPIPYYCDFQLAQYYRFCILTFSYSASTSSTVLSPLSLRCFH